MPIGIVSDEDFQKEINSYSRTTPGGRVITPASKPDTVLEGVILEKESPGRKKGDKNVPDSLRQLIGEEHLLNGRESAIQLAADFGISPSSVSAYANGATSTASYDSPKPSILNHINKARTRAMGRAAKTLNAALATISQEKLDYLDADKLSGVAKDMSVIIKNLEPKHASEGATDSKAPQFVIFAPQFRDERSYDSITVQE